MCAGIRTRHRTTDANCTTRGHLVKFWQVCSTDKGEEGGMSLSSWTCEEKAVKILVALGPVEKKGEEKEETWRDDLQADWTAAIGATQGREPRGECGWAKSKDVEKKYFTQCCLRYKWPQPKAPKACSTLSLGRRRYPCLRSLWMHCNHRLCQPFCRHPWKRKEISHKRVLGLGPWRERGNLQSIYWGVQTHWEDDVRYGKVPLRNDLRLL